MALVIYESRYGSTERYAQWIASEIGAELVHLPDVAPEEFPQHEVILFGSPILLHDLQGIDLLTRHEAVLSVRRTAFFFVGMSLPDGPERRTLIEHRIPAHVRSWLKIFQLEGALDRRRLSMRHKIMLQGLKNTAKVMNLTRPTEGSRHFARVVSQPKVDLVRREAIAPIVSWAVG